MLRLVTTVKRLRAFIARLQYPPVYGIEDHMPPIVCVECGEEVGSPCLPGCPWAEILGKETP